MKTKFLILCSFVLYNNTPQSHKNQMLTNGQQQIRIGLEEWIYQA